MAITNPISSMLAHPNVLAENTRTPERVQPQDPLVISYPTVEGPRTTAGLRNIISRLGPYAISRRNLTDRIFNFAEGTAFGLRVEEKSYEASDPYVQSCAVRRSVAESLRVVGGGRKVAFVESAGLLELGGGFIGVLPLDSFAPYGGIALNYGFTASTLMRYRSSAPKLLGFDERPEQGLDSSKMEFPGTAQKALSMVPGSEMELCGQGKLLVNAVVALRIGRPVGVAIAGLGAVVAGSTTSTNETSVHILALDKPGKVRVTIRHLDEESIGVLARIRLGLNFAPSNIVSNVAGGMLRYYVEKMGAPNFEELVNMYTTLYVTFTGKNSHRGLAIGSWDVDLHNPQGREAYENLLRLNTVKPDELASLDSHSVTKVKLQESEYEFKFGADVGMAGEKLLIFETLKTLREGRLDRASGQPLLYKDSLYSRRITNILTGSKTIDWEAVSLKNGEDGESEPYLRVHFTQKDWDFSKDGIDRTLRFAKAMQIAQAQINGADEKELEIATERLCKLAEVTLQADVYFTKKGVENIDKADSSQAKEAFLRVSSLIRRKFKGVDFTATDAKTCAALELIEEYQKYSGIQNIGKIAERLKVVPQIREQYFKLMGRKIHVDAKLIKQAEEFGKAVERLTDTKSVEQVSSFFLALGERNGFDYRQTVAALSQLAGEEETLVNDLSITGGSVVIKNTSEGGITNPRDTVTAELYRVAD